MNRLLPALLLCLIAASAASGQTVISDCTAPDNIIGKYAPVADRMALTRIYELNSPYKDSSLIPHFWRDSFLRPLLAVYNAIGLPARDTVVDMFNIKYAYGYYSLRNLAISADSSLLWMHNLRIGVYPVGNAIVDSFISSYGFSSIIYDYSPYFYCSQVIFHADTNYNLERFHPMLLSESGIINVDPISYGSKKGSYIFDSVFSDHIQLTYRYAWGDCESGCIFARDWIFNVYPDCTVEYKGSSGDELYPTSVMSAVSTKNGFLFPNPANDVLNINIGLPLQSIGIYAPDGRLLLRAPDGTKQIDVHSLPAGLYFLKALGRDQAYSLSFIKQ